MSIGNPERIEYVLHNEARLIEQAQRDLLAYWAGFSYELVIPPLADSIDTLLDNAAGHLGDLTLRLTDPLGGKPIGIRADITPQIRRLDARRYAACAVVRLCYCGSTLYSRPTKPWLNREQLQAGAELFGGNATEAATEIIMLAHGSLAALGIKDLFIALGHASLCNNLLKGVDEQIAARVRKYLAKRDTASINVLSDELGNVHDNLVLLNRLHGGADTLQRSRKRFGNNAAIVAGIDELDSLSTLLRNNDIAHSFDLASLSGYAYHTGFTFAILAGDSVLVRGGAFGATKRQATGFSLDIRNLPQLLGKQPEPASFASLRHYGAPAWRTAISNLQARGLRCVLVDDWQQVPASCKQRLVKQDSTWQLTAT